MPPSDVKHILRRLFPRTDLITSHRHLLLQLTKAMSVPSVFTACAVLSSSHKHVPVQLGTNSIVNTGINYQIK